MRSMLVIGLGRFGTNLAIKLSELKNEVMVVDRSEAAVNAIAPQVTSAYAGNCMDEEVVRALGVGNFDVCFVCISDDFQSSLEITSLLKEHGAKYVVSKTDRAMHAKFLRKLGADAVVYPERDMAHRVAIRYSAQNVFDYVEITPEYAVQEMRVPASWAGENAAPARCARKIWCQRHRGEGGRTRAPHRRCGLPFAGKRPSAHFRRAQDIGKAGGELTACTERAKESGAHLARRLFYAWASD